MKQGLTELRLTLLLLCRPGGPLHYQSSCHCCDTMACTLSIVFLIKCWLASSQAGSIGGVQEVEVAPQEFGEEGSCNL